MRGPRGGADGGSGSGSGPEPEPEPEPENGMPVQTPGAAVTTPAAMPALSAA